MSTAPDKKPGRNEPCWCGSGKKYKHCHLRADQEAAQAERQAAAAEALAATPPPMPLPFSPPPSIEPWQAPELTPEEKAAEAEYERFEAADLEGKTAIYVQWVDEKRLEGEDAFEMLLAIREASKPSEDAAARAQFRMLAERLQAALPAVYREERGPLLEWLIQDAIVDQDWGRVADLFSQLAKIADHEIEAFFQVLNALSYYGQTELLSATIKRVWPKLAGSSEITSWGVQELANLLLDLNLFHYLATTDDPRADDPALAKGLPEGLSYDQARLAGPLSHLAAPGTWPWQRADFGDTVDADTWMDNVALLLFDFAVERQRTAEVPLSRSNLIREPLTEVLQRQLGRFAPGKPKAKRSRTPRPLSLVPDRAALDDVLGNMFNLFGGRKPYTAAALIALLPSYLGFLARLGLIHPSEMDAALADLRELADTAHDVARSFEVDAFALRNVETAWSDTALGALRRDPALEEARSQPLVVAPPAPDPLAEAHTYLLKVTYLRADDVWFVFEMPRDRTLHDLHRAIRSAAKFDDDHLYSFYLSGRAWDKETEYSTGESRYSSRIKIGELPLRIKQHFLYLFDYGDEHTFDIQLLGAGPTAGKTRDWRIVEKHGTMPPQYEMWDEGDEVDEDEDEDQEDSE